MPIPTPETGESQDDFVARCMGNETMKEDYPDNEQRLAVCFNSWREERGNMHEAKLKEWFSIKSQDGEKVTELLIYDEIGGGMFSSGIGAQEFIQAVKDLKLKKSDELMLRINSPGGDVFDAVAIYNYLRSSVKGRITARVDGMAASAASIIAMAGDRVEMPENTFLFIHKPWMLAMGNADVMRKAAEDLDVVETGMVSTYLRRAADKLTKKKLQDLMREETWLTAEESVSYGLADEMAEPVRMAALLRFDLPKYGYHHVPEALMRKKPDHSDRFKKIESLRVAVSGEPRA